MKKVEWWSYQTVKKTLKIIVTVYTQYRRVTDGQTDKRTDNQSIIKLINQSINQSIRKD